MIASPSSNYFLRFLANLSHLQLWLLSLSVSVVMSETMVVIIEMLLKGEVSSDFLLTGLVTSFLVASIISAGLIYLLSHQRQIEEVLLESKGQLQDAQRLAHVGSWQLDIPSKKLIWSDEIYRIFEIDPITIGTSYETFLEVVHPEDRDRVDRTYAESVKNHTPYEIEHRLLLPDGRIKFVHERCKTFYDAHGKPIRSVGTVQNITKRKLAEEALRTSEMRFRAVLEYAPIGMAIVSLEGGFMLVNHALCEIVGYEKNELEALTFQEITHPDDLAADLTNVGRLLNGEIRAYQMEKRYIRKNGQLIWVQMTASILRDSDNKPLHFIAQIEDISERKDMQKYFQQLAHYDTLTELPNRRLLIDRFNHAFAQAKRYHRSMAVMYLDLDHFKVINDNLGHDAGDEILKQVASRLNGCVRGNDTISRQGGDEFVIVLAEISQAKDAESVARKIIDTLEEPISFNDEKLSISASIGIAIYPLHEAMEAEKLMKKADIAMYSAKSAGRHCYRLYDGISV